VNPTSASYALGCVLAWTVFKRRVPNFRCADARVSEQSLDHSYISAVLHVGCRAVPEGMRVDSLLDAGQCDPLVDGSRDGARKDSTVPL